MRILFFSTAFPQPYEPSRNPDNLERCIALARDHEVHVISPLSWRQARAAHLGTKDPWVSSRLTISRPLSLYPPGVLRGTHAWCMWQSIRHSAARTIATFKPHAVLSYWTYPDSAAAMKVAELAGVPCVAIVGGSDVLSLLPKARGAQARRVIDVLDGVDSIAAVSASLKEHMQALGVSGDKIHVLPPAVDTTRFSPGLQEQARRELGIPLDSRVVVWVGRMVAVKALDVLLAAIAELTRSFPTLRLQLVGDGPLRRSLEAKVFAAGFASHVTFAGPVPHRDLPRYYRAADVTVLPSHWEGMPNALLESHACGTPFVATRVGAIPELAIDEVDELVTPGDSEQLAAALANCLRRTPAERGAVVSNAGSWDQMAARLTHLLEAARSRGLTSNAPASAPIPLVVRGVMR